MENSSSKYILGIFIDFVGAFDNLTWEAILRKLNFVKARDLKLWRSYFSDRFVVFEGNSQEFRREVTQGCPQGSICDPFIWNLVMNDLLLSLFNAGVKSVAYADDLLILVEGNSRKDIEDRGTDMMGIVADFADRVGLTISTSKTECMLLKGILAPTRPPWIRVNGQPIRYATQVRYLGLTVSSRLNFLPHFNNLRSRLAKITAQFKRVLRRKWGPSITIGMDCFLL